jgi:hypothetical protein
MVELIKQLEEEDEQWLAAPALAARIPHRRSISTWPIMATHDQPPRETNRLTLRPGLGHVPRLKGYCRRRVAQNLLVPVWEMSRDLWVFTNRDLWVPYAVAFIERRG